MSHQDEHDLLDLRLLGYLHDKGELAAQSGPGVHAVVTSIAGASAPRTRLGVIGRLPAMAWIALSLILLLTVILAAGLTGGGLREPSLVIVPTPTASTTTAVPSDGNLAADALLGSWVLDFETSGIDNAYGGSPGPDGLEFWTYVTFDVDGRFEVSSGAGGGCAVPGLWTVAGNEISIDISTDIDGCEATGPGPAARDIRRRLAEAVDYRRAGTRLTLDNGAGAPLLVLFKSDS